jgi:PilZ domain
VYPADGLDAEELLAEADRRMYHEKQQQPNRKNRRIYPRMRGRLTIEFQPEGGAGPVLGNLTNISLGGCYVETGVILAPETRLQLNFSIDDDRLAAEGSVVRCDPGVGLAIKFKEGSRGERAHLQQIIEFVDRSTKLYDSQYASKLARK